jgi:hypothetical protein
MINWIKQFFVVERKTTTLKKCNMCFLRADYFMLIQFQGINLEEIDNKILIQICESCYNEINERYNPHGIPPFIQEGVFTKELLGRKK